MDEKYSKRPDLEHIPFEPIFVARQPVFDRDLTIWGYELLFRHSSSANSAEIASADSATAQVIVDGVSIALESLNEARRILINFPQDLLLQGTPYALPRENCVIEILETVSPTTDVVDACRKFREAGYTLALDDFQGDSSFEPLIKQADIVKVDVYGLAPPELIRITKSLSNSNAVLLAEKIEDKRTFLLAKALGYALFQGYYLSRPEIFPGRKISIGTIARLRLLNELLRKDYEVKKLSRIITSDPSLSYRLLRFVNSMAFALSNKISSISQAVAYMGGMSLSQWLMAVAIADATPSPRSEELAFRCVQRGKFLELLAMDFSPSSLSHENMFLLGLFSNLDMLLGLSMEDIFQQMPLDDPIKHALQFKQGGLYCWLELAYAIEAGNWPAVTAKVNQLGLQQNMTAQMHLAAVNWASKLLRTTRQ